MVNSDEKKEFLTNLIFNISLDDDVSEIQAKLYDLLLRDTREGKLYKYRTFDEKQELRTRTQFNPKNKKEQANLLKTTQYLTEK